MRQREHAIGLLAAKIFAPVEHRLLQGVPRLAAKMEALRVGADSEDELDPREPREEPRVPKSRAFLSRRKIAAMVVEPWEAEAHRDDGDAFLVIEVARVDAHPCAQAVPRRVREREAGSVHARS